MRAKIPFLPEENAVTASMNRMDPRNGNSLRLDFCSRYLHRVRIANSGILDDIGDLITFRTKGRVSITLSRRTFVPRFLLHFLPPPLTKVRQRFPLPRNPPGSGLEIVELWRRPLTDLQGSKSNQSGWDVSKARVCFKGFGATLKGRLRSSSPGM